MIGNMPKAVAITMLSDYRQSLLKMIDGLYSDGFMMIDALELAIKALENDVAYICDQRYCSDGCKNPDCRHTCDINHAKNFVRIGPGKWTESDDEVEELRERVAELEELLRDPDRINSSSYYTLGRL